MFGICPPFGGTWEPSQRAREWVEDLQWSMAESHRLIKVAAAVMGTTGPMLARIFNFKTHVPPMLVRIADLGEEFERALIKRRAPKVGLRVVDGDVADLVALVRALGDEREKGAA